MTLKKNRNLSITPTEIVDGVSCQNHLGVQNTGHVIITNKNNWEVLSQRKTGSIKLLMRYGEFELREDITCVNRDRVHRCPYLTVEILAIWVGQCSTHCCSSRQ